MTIKEKIKNLEKSQKEIDKKIYVIDENSFLDGIIDIEKYVNSSIKIMWILKEPNSDEKDANWREYIQEINDGSGNLGGFAKTFTKIIYTTYGILNRKTWSEIEWISDNPKIVEAIEQIAFINIKKTPGGSVSYDNELTENYSDFKDIVIEQIELYSPNVIIGGNTIQFIKQDLEILYPDLKYKYFIESSNLGISFSEINNLIVFDAYHPGYAINQEIYCNDMITNFIQIFKSKENNS
jgi:hypothetical protein